MFDGTLSDERAQGMGLESGTWVNLGSLNVTNEQQESVQLYSGTQVVGRKLDVLGFRIGETRAFSITERSTYNGDGNPSEYTMTSCEELPGNWSLPQDRSDLYETAPVGNCLSDAELQSVCDQLNVVFTQLRNGTYTTEWKSDPTDAMLSVWNVARPVPVEVTPQMLRSDVLKNSSSDTSPVTQVWIPLPDNCWAVCTLSEDGSLQLLNGFDFALTVLDVVSAQ